MGDLSSVFARFCFDSCLKEGEIRADLVLFVSM